MLNNIVLIGFMGSGKSSVGRELARLCGSVLLDTDSIIETNYKMSVAAFFKRFGEERFRECEVGLCDWIRDNVKNAIISTGGGLPTRYDLREIGFVCYLEAPLEELKNRIEKDGLKKRPLAAAHALDALYNARISVYEKMADYSVSTLSSADEVAQKIYQSIKGY